MVCSSGKQIEEQSYQDLNYQQPVWLAYDLHQNVNHILFKGGRKHKRCCPLPANVSIVTNIWENQKNKKMLNAEWEFSRLICTQLLMLLTTWRGATHNEEECQSGMSLREGVGCLRTDRHTDYPGCNAHEIVHVQMYTWAMQNIARKKRGITPWKTKGPPPHPLVFSTYLPQTQLCTHLMIHNSSVCDQIQPVSWSSHIIHPQLISHSQSEHLARFSIVQITPHTDSNKSNI